MMQKIQRFGGAMFTPVLLFAFAGIMAGLSTLFQNPAVMGSIADPSTGWFKVWGIIANGAWTVFRNMPLVFAVGLPVGLAKKQNARACLEALVLYLTFNYFLSQILTYWGSSFGVDLALVGTTAADGTVITVDSIAGATSIAGIPTLDMGIIGGLVISGIVIALHNKFFDTKLPDWLGIFKGSTFVFALGFFIMIPAALVSAAVWPHVQEAFASLQTFLAGSGSVGVGIYAFLNRILIPTGLHHFIYSPFLYDNAIIPGGIVAAWLDPANMKHIAETNGSLRDLFPAGGFSLYSMGKIFGSVGISLAFYATAKPEKKKMVAGLLIPATLTAIFAGVTEPLEFTFLFISPPLFAVHAVLCGLMDMVCYMFGISGYMSGGLIEDVTMNWMPMWAKHSGQYIIQIIIGLVFVAIYFAVFKFLIQKFKIPTPGREADNEETKLFTKADFQEKKKSEKGEVKDGSSQAQAFLDALGGKENIEDITNCATRLRVTVFDESLVQDVTVFKTAGAHGLVAKGKALQVIIGLSVPTVREEVEKLMR